VTPGGFRTRPRIAVLRAHAAFWRGLFDWFRIVTWWSEQVAGYYRWHAQQDYARLCPHPWTNRRTSWMNRGWITCELCDRCIHTPKGWLVPIPEYPNACTCNHLPHHERGEHYAECPQLWMLADGLERPEALPAALPKPPTATVRYTTADARRLLGG
jgi:hypothetical protein